MIFFTIYAHIKPIEMLSFHCHKLIGKIKKHERKKMVTC